MGCAEKNAFFPIKCTILCMGCGFRLANELLYVCNILMLILSKDTIDAIIPRYIVPDATASNKEKSGRYVVRS